MKLRIKDNSVRLRLMKSEVAELAKKGNIESKVQFPNLSELIYSIRSSKNIKEISTKCKNNIIEVILPNELLQSWASSETVSIEANLKLSKKKTLHVLIEKDFACLTERAGEDESDAYPNPNLTC